MGLTGTLPEVALSQWTNLYELYVGWNQLTGTLPETIFTAWTNIEVLYSNNNQLSGSLSPKIGMWTNLREIFGWKHIYWHHTDLHWCMDKFRFGAIQ
jgi:hypothetical protein